MCDVHWCVTVDYQQIENGNIANQIHGFTIDYGKFILIVFSKFSAPTIAFLAFWLAENSDYEPMVGVLRHMENSAPSLKNFAL